MKCISPANTALVTRGAKQGVSKQCSFTFCGVSTNPRGFVFGCILTTEPLPDHVQLS